MESAVYSLEFILIAGGYVASLLVLAYFTYQPKATDQEYFLARRRLPLILALVSSIATETSVATILIFPQIGFQEKLSLLWLPLGYILGRFIAARFYLPSHYKSQSLSIYENICQNKRAQGLLSYAYLTAKFISGGVRFFLGAHALSSLFGGDIWLWLLIIAGACSIYSLLGGIRAVVWTDQIQGGLIFFMGLGLLFSLALNFFQQNTETVWEVFSSLRFFDWNADISNAYFSPMLFFGGLVLSIGSHGTDQDLLQRILAVSSLKQAQRTLFYSGIGAFCIIAVYCFVGYFLALQNIEGLNSKTPLISYIQQSNSKVLVSFFSVLLFAAAMSTIDSALHAASAVWKAVLVPKPKLSFFYSAPFFSLLSLLCLCAFAQGASYLEKYSSDFLSLAMGSMNYVNGGLIGVFTRSLFHKRKLSFGRIGAGLLCGFGVTLAAAIAAAHFDFRLAWPYVTLASAAAALVGVNGGNNRKGENNRV